MASSTPIKAALLALARGGNAEADKTTVWDRTMELWAAYKSSDDGVDGNEELGASIAAMDEFVALNPDHPLSVILECYRVSTQVARCHSMRSVYKSS